MTSITIVTKQTKHTTGHGRYANSLMKAMPDIKVINAIGMKVPRFLLKLGRLFGKDIDFVVQTRPTALSEIPKSDVVHYMNQFLALPLTKRKYRAKANIVTVHDVMQLSGHDTYPSNPIQRWFLKKCFKGCTYADRIITPSECIKQDINKYLNYPLDKIDIVYEGVDHEVFKPRKDAPEINYFDPGKKNILYVGNDLDRKNVLRMIKAFAQVKKQIPNAHFLIVGASVSEKNRKEAMNLVENLHLRKDITFVGQVTEGMLPYFYNKADCFLFPTLYEGFGLPPLEAMASGCPTIVSTQGSLPEIAGLGIPQPNPYDIDAIANEILRILEDDEHRKNVINKGLERSKRFTWDKAARGTIEVYKKALTK